MKLILKYYCFLFFLVLPCLNSVLAQKQDSLIELYPGLGIEIERLDKEYYGIFKEYDDFEMAVFYIRDDKYFVSKIKFFRQSSLYDAVLVKPISGLDSIRSVIDAVETRELVPDVKTEVAVVTSTGDRYEGRLEMFSKRYLYLYSDKSISTGTTSHLRIKIPVSFVEAVILPGESNVLTGMGWGGLAGLLIGLVISTSVEQNNFWIYDAKMMVAGFFALLGAGIGALIGLGASSGDQVIDIASTDDLIKLKDLAKYNPGDISPPGVKYFTIESL